MNLFARFAALTLLEKAAVQGKKAAFPLNAFPIARIMLRH